MRLNKALPLRSIKTWYTRDAESWAFEKFGALQGLDILKDWKFKMVSAQFLPETRLLHN